MQGARWILALVAALMLVVACGGSDKKYMMPVDSPAKPFIAPETDELVEGDEGGDAWGGDDDDDDDDDSGGATTPAPTPPAAKPATPPVTPTTPPKKK